MGADRPGGIGGIVITDDLIGRLRRAEALVATLPAPAWTLIAPDGRCYQGGPDGLTLVLLAEINQGGIWSATPAGRIV